MLCAFSKFHFDISPVFSAESQASFSGEGRGDQQPSGEDEEGQTLEYVTGEKLCSNPCIELEPPQPCYLDQRHVASHTEGSPALRCGLHH